MHADTQTHTHTHTCPNSYTSNSSSLWNKPSPDLVTWCTQIGFPSVTLNNPFLLSFHILIPTPTGLTSPFPTQSLHLLLADHADSSLCQESFPSTSREPAQLTPPLSLGRSCHASTKPFPDAAARVHPTPLPCSHCFRLILITVCLISIFTCAVSPTRWWHYQYHVLLLSIIPYGLVLS